MAKVTRDLRYGMAIAKLRTATGLTQSAIAGLSERHVRRIEKGEGRTTYESLRLLAAAHRMHIDDYLRLVAEMLLAGKEDWLAVLKECPVRMDDVPPRRREMAKKRGL